MPAVGLQGNKVLGAFRAVFRDSKGELTGGSALEEGIARAQGRLPGLQIKHPCEFPTKVQVYGHITAKTVMLSHLLKKC